MAKRPRRDLVIEDVSKPVVQTGIDRLKEPKKIQEKQKEERVAPKKEPLIIPEEIKAFVEVEDESDFPINRYYVTKDQSEIYDDIIRVGRISEELHAMGLPYLNSCILYGIPGTGKTTFCKYVAYKLDLPYVYINFAKMIDGIFGNTARNISAIFRFLADHRVVFVMDEIDCIATKRGTEGAATGGELSRITITIMQELDYYKRHNVKSILLAATNRVDMLDPALVSRFAISREVKPLNIADKEVYILNFLEDIGVPYDPKNVKNYCIDNSTITNRNVESDIIRCASVWVEDKSKQFILSHYRE